MLIKDIAAQANTTNRTIQRDIEAFNKANSTSHSDSLKEHVIDVDLLQYLQQKRNFSMVTAESVEEKRLVLVEAIEEHIQSNANTAVLSNDKPIKRTDTPGKPKKSSHDTQPKATQAKKTDLQTRLSADWLIMSVLIVILFADVISFGLIGDHEIGDRFQYSWIFFGIMGLATGLGSIVTYNRIQDEKLAVTWKITFGVLQFSVFEFAVNEIWVAGGVVMMLMLVLVFIGAQRSIKG